MDFYLIVFYLEFIKRADKPQYIEERVTKHTKQKEKDDQNMMKVD